MIRLLVNLLEVLLNTFYRDRFYPRFYVLETVARVPYFAYTSVMHLYETMGWWRKSDWLKVHFAESWNELHHLLIADPSGVIATGLTALWPIQEPLSTTGSSLLCIFSLPDLPTSLCNWWRNMLTTPMMPF